MQSVETETRTYNPPSKNIPHGVWVLGFVSLLMDVSSELIGFAPVLPDTESPLG